MRNQRTLLSLAAAGLFVSLASQSQEAPATPAPAESAPAANAPLNMPPASTPAPAQVTVPARGTTMDSVRAKFGAPSQEQPAVGAPPITRWDYPGYSVFFEHDKVLHTVVSR